MNKAELSSSRKYKLALLSLGILSLAWVLGGWVPLLSTGFNQLTASVMGLLALYYTGNVGNKFVVGRYLNQKQAATHPPGDLSGNH